MTVKMEATFQNGGHENIKKCIYIYIIFWRISMCNTYSNRFFKVKEFTFDTFKLKMMFIFQNDGNT